MFDLNLWRGSSDESRRDVLERLAKLAFGVSVFPLLPRASHAAAKTKSGKAKQVIYLFMNGAMSHLDTFDPKPGAETQGETQPIDTKVMGIQIAEYFPEMASIMDRLAIVRSLSTATGAHEQGQYLMRTSYKPLASIRHPSLSSWVTKIRGRAGSDLPENILVGNSTRHPGAGFLAPNLAPVPIPTARLGLQNTKSPGYLKDSAFKRRMSLSKSFDKSFQARYENQQVDAYNQLYREAIKLLGSDSLAAFDINKESAETLEKYGVRTILVSRCFWPVGSLSTMSVSLRSVWEAGTIIESFIRICLIVADSWTRLTASCSLILRRRVALIQPWWFWQRSLAVRL